jgi:hypothetical protein
MRYILAGMNAMGQEERQSDDLLHTGALEALQAGGDVWLVHIKISGSDRSGAIVLADHLSEGLHQLLVERQAGSMSEYKYAYVLHEITSITFDCSRVKRRIVAVSTKPFRDNRPLRDERMELFAQSSSKKRAADSKRKPERPGNHPLARISWLARVDKIGSMA